MELDVTPTNITKVTLASVECFTPTNIYDVRRVRYCSYCFKANIDRVTHRGGQCTACVHFFEKNPSFCPNKNFENIKFLTYFYMKCHVGECTFETEVPLVMKKHLLKFHDHGSCSRLVENDVKLPSENAVTSSNTDPVHETSPVVPFPDSQIKNVTFDEKISLLKSVNLIPKPEKIVSKSDLTNSSQQPELNMHLITSAVSSTQKDRSLNSDFSVILPDPAFSKDYCSKTAREDMMDLTSPHQDDILDNVDLKQEKSIEKSYKDIVSEELLFDTLWPEKRQYHDDSGGFKHKEQQLTEETRAHDEFFKSYLDNFDMKCEFCVFHTKHRSSIRSHLVTKHMSHIAVVIVKDRLLVYNCRYCGDVFNKRSLTAAHYINKHMSRGKLTCEVCNTSLGDITMFGIHLKSQKHKDYYRRSHRCKVCGFGSFSKKHLYKHNLNVHGKTYKCDLCSFTAKLKSSTRAHRIKVHMLKKHKDGLFYCDECSFNTNNKSELYSHIIRGHGAESMQFLCEVCGFKGISEAGLKIHKSTHIT